MTQALRYQASFDAPASHRIDVALSIPAAPEELILWMPAWTPGSYLIREFARNLRDLSAVRIGARDGDALRIERLDKATFRVHAPAGDPVMIRYAVHAFERSVRTSIVEDDQALLNGASVFLALKGEEQAVHEVVVTPPSDWKVATALAKSGQADGSDPVFRARSYEHLIDSPIFCGPFEEVEFRVLDRLHRIVIRPGGDHDLERIARDTERIVLVSAALFGGLPYQEFLFQVITAAEGRGGLEHRDSCVIQFPRFGFGSELTYHDFLTLVAHEHFHVWNVKRIQPRDFVPYDLTAETYTTLLWVCEGITAYYDELLPLRAGVVDRGAYLQRLAESIDRYRQGPGRLAQDLADASMTAWIGLYRPDEDTPNAAVSYYLKGSLVILLLDLEIRTLSGSAHSLDDLMRLLWERFPDGSGGFSGEQFEACAAEVAGVDLSAFFDRMVRSTAELDLETPLAGFGVSLVKKPRPGGPSLRDLLGVRIRGGAGRAVIDCVEHGSPAHVAGLSPRDEIIAVDGYQATTEQLKERLSRMPGGSTVELALFRDGRLSSLQAVLPEELPGVHVIEEREDADTSQAVRAARESWLGTSVQK